MNIILEKTDQIPYFTKMRHVFRALGIAAADYDWFVSDLDYCYVRDVEEGGIDPAFTDEDRWIAGTALQGFWKSMMSSFSGVYSAHFHPVSGGVWWRRRRLTRTVILRSGVEKRSGPN